MTSSLRGCPWCMALYTAMMVFPQPYWRSYKPYVSDSKGGDKDKPPQYFQTTKGQKVLKKVAVFYSQVPMPCVVPNPNESIPTAKKAKYHIIPDATWETLMILMEETTDYRKAVAIVGISEKSVHRLQKIYLKTGGTVSIHTVCMSTVYMLIVKINFIARSTHWKV
ncbi:hypothetical protein DSO57_1015244 [Entomophthora muscae]|uniref:Uncharacterized protein n=1 Tax=Entomophthora muscae TaxID=34485 RepID=A0ACC2SIE1_9FUNG|nr:hypothetical protein DSO57_1015244 [Entomophthora muscae]